MILDTYEQQPGEKLDYDIDFSEWLAPGDSIVSVTSSIETGPDSALTIDSPVPTVFPNGKMIKQWVSDGTNGVTYVVNFMATMNSGAVKEVELKFKIKEIA